MITDNQRKRLENAGYTVSKSGTSVLTKDGTTIGGINSNGKVFSGSDTVAKILKGSGGKDSGTKASEKPRERRTVAKSESKAPTQSKRPKQRQTGRGEPNYGEAADKPTKTPMGGPRRGRKTSPAKSKVDSGQPIAPRAYTQEEAEAQLKKQNRTPLQKLSDNFKEKREKGKSKKPLLRSDSKPTFKEFMENKRQSNPDAFRSDPSGFTERMRNMYKEEFGFNKGGMVKSGNKDYKKSGMFYKSGSPRGYK